MRTVRRVSAAFICSAVCLASLLAMPACSTEAAEPPSSAIEGNDVAVEASQEAFPPDSLLEAHEVNALLEGDTRVSLIDVRPPVLYAANHIEGSRNIPAGRDFSVRLSEVPAEGIVVLVDADDGSSLSACRAKLISAGRAEDEIFALLGGVTAWVESGYPVKARTFHRC